MSINLSSIRFDRFDGFRERRGIIRIGGVGVEKRCKRTYYESDEQTGQYTDTRICVALFATPIKAHFIEATQVLVSSPNAHALLLSSQPIEIVIENEVILLSLLCIVVYCALYIMMY